MSNEELSKIHLNNLAIPNKYYYGNNNKVYIGTKNGRLKLLDKANVITFKPTEDISSKNVQGAIEEINEDSGVASGIYGNATNVPQITIDDKGKITNAIDIPISSTPGYISSISDTGTIDLDVTTGNLTANFINAAGYITPSSSSALTNKTGNISQWTNDSGYITTSGVVPAALTKSDDTNVTATLTGTPATSLLQSVNIALGWTGTLADGRIASASTWNSKQDAYSASNFGTFGASLGNATPNDSDIVVTVETTTTKKITWTNVKAFLKTYFDAIYTTTSAVAIQISTALSGYLTSATAASTYALAGSSSTQTRLRSAALSITSATATNVTASALVLAAGTWDISAMIGFLPTTTTSITIRGIGAISLTSATLPATDTDCVPTLGEVRVTLGAQPATVGGAATPYSALIPSYRVTFAGSTTLYLVAQATFTASTLSVYGIIEAKPVK